MRLNNQQALVLRTHKYSETSMLIDIFSRSSGRLRLMAKGARRSKSASANFLQPFVPLSLSWSGKSDLKTMTGAEGGKPLLTRPDRLMSGFYINELIYYLTTEYDANELLFEACVGVLMELEVEENQEVALRQFELRLLEELGYGVNMHEDDQGVAITDYSNYAYQIGTGFRRLESLNPTESPLTIPGPGLIRLSNNHWDAETLRIAKYLCRVSIDHLLAGRELQSRKWAQTLKPAKV